MVSKKMKVQNDGGTWHSTHLFEFWYFVHVISWNLESCKFKFLQVSLNCNVTIYNPRMTEPFMTRQL